MTHIPQFSRRQRAQLIAAYQNKGGAGKSSTATNLAGVACRHGRIGLLDVDPNSGLTKRMQRAAANGIDTALMPLLHCHYSDDVDYASVDEEVSALNDVIDRLSMDRDQLWIDTAPNLHKPSIHAITRADLIIIPAFSSPDDIDEARMAIQSILAERDTFPGAIAVLPFRQKSATGLARAFESCFADFGEEILILPAAKDYDTNVLASLAGQPTVEYASGSPAAANWRYIFAQVTELLNKIKETV